MVDGLFPGLLTLCRPKTQKWIIWQIMEKTQKWIIWQIIKIQMKCSISSGSASKTKLNIFRETVLKAKQKNELFLGQCSICFKSPTLLFFYCFLKRKMNKDRIYYFITLLSVTTMRFHSNIVVHCG